MRVPSGTRPLIPAMGLVLAIFILPALAISWFVPAEELSLTAGIMQAFEAVFAQFNLTWLTPIVGIMLVAASLGGMLTWLAGPSKGLLLISRQEGFPLAILEAMRAGLPVIASDVPGCRHAVDEGETGLLCEARSAHSLAEAMTAFAAMPARERAAMGARAREKAQREFSEAVVVDFYLDSLRNIGL